MKEKRRNYSPSEKVSIPWESKPIPQVISHLEKNPLAEMQHYLPEHFFTLIRGIYRKGKYIFPIADNIKRFPV